MTAVAKMERRHRSQAAMSQNNDHRQLPTQALLPLGLLSSTSVLPTSTFFSWNESSQAIGTRSEMISGQSRASNAIIALSPVDEGRTDKNDEAVSQPSPPPNERETQHQNVGNSVFPPIRLSGMVRRFSSMVLGTTASPVDPLSVTAVTLVDDIEVIEAERINATRTNKSKLLIFAVLFLVPVTAFAVLGVLFFTSNNEVIVFEEMPSMSPSNAPTLDGRPTLVRVQERKKLLCGARKNRKLDLNKTDQQEGFLCDLCRAVAAIVIGGRGDNFEEVEIIDFKWAGQLISRKVDVLFAGVTHTLQREIREVKFVHHRIFYPIFFSFCNIYNS
mmetsp:Transcript_1544/g.3244  ORF Transcript_1544/g.3244 Transcript_1544/m.3244 type:complete len:331 (-) Transcript_1544:306-1298(-)